jgi:hypothetical protein
VIFLRQQVCKNIGNEQIANRNFAGQSADYKESDWRVRPSIVYCIYDTAYFAFVHDRRRRLALVGARGDIQSSSSGFSDANVVFIV